VTALPGKTILPMHVPVKLGFTSLRANSEKTKGFWLHGGTKNIKNHKKDCEFQKAKKFQKKVLKKFWLTCIH
jgi:hypothetical protein